MISTYKEKIIKAIGFAKNLDDISFIEEKIKSTPQINRRANEGKLLQQELLSLTNQKARQLIDEGATPF